MANFAHHIRLESPSDIDAIEAVTIAVFLHAPHTSHTEQFIIRGLRAGGVLTISLVAELDAVILGHVAISPVTISDGTTGWYGLGPVSVLPEHQGKGIGSRLIQEALARLKDLRAQGCVVLGEPSYYQRFGFQTHADLILPEVPAEYFMALGFTGKQPRGIVAYHPAFAAKD